MRRREFIAGDPIGGKCTPVPPTLAPLHDWWWPRSSARVVGRIVCLSVMASAAVGLSSDVLWAPMTATELKVLKMVIAKFPDVARDRYESLNGAYTWKIPSFPACRNHWGLPLSSLDPYAAVYLKAIYAGGNSSTFSIVAAALKEAAHNGTPSDGRSELFCDPMTWEFWLDPFTKKLLPKEQIGVEAASAILRTEILANRSHGYLSAALRSELDAELAKVRGALPKDMRERVSRVKVTTDVFGPLAASADHSTMTITLSEGLVRYAFIRSVVGREGELVEILKRLAVSGDQGAATTDLTRLSAQTLAAFRESLSFTIGHELAHLWVPTIDEREADCNGLATVIAERGDADIGIFASIEDAVAQGRSAYWNGLPAQLIDHRFKLIEVWQRAAKKGANIHAVCVEAWKGLEGQ
jgi:hypothetical protein